MIVKAIVLALIIVVVYFLLFKKRSKRRDRIEEFVPCEKCGTYISAKEALIGNGKYFCSKECMR